MGLGTSSLGLLIHRILIQMNTGKCNIHASEHRALVNAYDVLYAQLSK